MLFSLKSITIFTLLLITLFKWVDSRSASSSSTTTTTTTTSSTTTSETKTTESTTTITPNESSESSTTPLSKSSSLSLPSTEKDSKSWTVRISRRSTNWNFSSSSPSANEPPISLKLIIKLIGGILFSITLLCMCCCLNFRDKRVPGYSGSIRGYRSDTMKRRGTQQA